MKEYFDRKAVSNSGISNINPDQGGSPAKYKSVVLDREVSLDTPSLENGKLIHLYVEDPDAFIVADVVKPTSMLAEWVEEVHYHLVTTEELIFAENEHLRDIAFESRGDRYKSTKHEDKVWLKFQEGFDYLKFLIRGNGKIALTLSQKEVIDNCVASLHWNKLSHSLLFDSQLMSTEMNELAIYWDEVVYLPQNVNVQLKCKGLLDRVIIVEEEKKATLVDLKTTGKPLANFQNSFDYYRYYRQMAWYKHALLKYIADFYGDNIGWEIDVYIVAVETSYLHECKVFSVSEAYLEKGKVEYAKLIEDIASCESTGDWNTWSNESFGVISLTPED